MSEVYDDPLLIDPISGHISLSLSYNELVAEVIRSNVVAPIESVKQSIQVLVKAMQSVWFESLLKETMTVIVIKQIHKNENSYLQKAMRRMSEMYVELLFQLNQP